MGKHTLLSKIGFKVEWLTEESSLRRACFCAGALWASANYEGRPDLVDEIEQQVGIEEIECGLPLGRYALDGAPSVPECSEPLLLDLLSDGDGSLGVAGAASEFWSGARSAVWDLLPHHSRAAMAVMSAVKRGSGGRWI